MFSLLPQAVEGLLFDRANRGYGTSAHRLTLGYSHPDRLRTALWLVRLFLGEIRLDVQPIRTPPAGIEQDEDDWHRLKPPQIDISQVKIEDVVRPRFHKRFRRLELEVHK